MLFDFELTPLAQVAPWGEPGHLQLHWFGLSDGTFRILAGEATLFEYSGHARARGAPRYFNYQVVRPFEDLLDMLGTILEPVPPQLIGYLSGDARRALEQRHSAWTDANVESMEPDDYWAIADPAWTWIGQRSLDTGYLSPSARILMWSDATHVHIEWDNRDRCIDGGCAWSAIEGRHRLTRRAFLDEVETFAARFIGAMGARVGQVAAGALRADIRVDVPGLIAEQRRRSAGFAQAMRSRAATAWHEVERAIGIVYRSGD